MDTNSPFGNVVYAYTRTQAIDDSVLVNLSQFPVIRVFWTHNVCCTGTVWSVIDEAVKGGCDLDGVLHDISWIAKTTISQGNRGSDIVNFRVTIGSRTLDLKLVCGPGDHAEPVLTLMLPDED